MSNFAAHQRNLRQLALSRAGPEEPPQSSLRPMGAWMLRRLLSETWSHLHSDCPVGAASSAVGKSKASWATLIFEPG